MISIIGVDPGGTTGVALLQMRPGADGTPRYCCPKAFQVRSVGNGARDIVETLEDRFGELLAAHRRRERGSGSHLVFAVEAYVVNARAGRASTPQAGHAARKVIGQLHGFALTHDAIVLERSASLVKLWATDARLRRAGGALSSATGAVPASSLYDATAKLPHARDAARHALYAARHDVHWPDPLSRSYWESLDALTSADTPGE